MRDYVADRVGPELLAEALAVTDDPRELDPASLPRNFVIKPAHSWGGVIVWDGADPEELLPRPAPSLRTPSSLPRVWTGRASVGCPTSGSRCASGGYPARRSGRTGTSRRGCSWRSCSSTSTAACPATTRSSFSTAARTWSQSSTTVSANTAGALHDRLGGPAGAVEVRACPRRAEATPLGADARDRGVARAETDFVRVDLYSLPDRVVVGELTNYPERSYTIFDPPGFDEELGRPRPPRRYR